MARFKTRARTVDMLGRQQIAGIPNAISELFKNAHDAYADRVEVDYFGRDGLFVLRDDGLGMTKEDFEERWLTLGTESKIEGGKLPPPPVDKNKKPRPIIGEKGIGRLAIAIIGPQVLVLTRAKRDGALYDLVASFIHWGLFECPGINLDQVEIPVYTFSGGTLPTEDDITNMVEEVRQNVQYLHKNEEISPSSAERILRDLDKFHVNLRETAGFLDGPGLLGEGHGTHFYILPASENLLADVETDLKGTEVSDLRKLLLGFTNTMTPSSPPTPITAEFRYWRTDEQYDELVGPREFLTPEEFEMADHHISGEFDEFGQFKGVVTAYDEEPVEHVIPWPKSAGTRTACGPFRINMAYVQGFARESKIPPAEYDKLSTKLDLMGGLYIYRDGIRVLPYGDTDVDFLEIEKRRTKGAGYYFFSYRRMFGTIEVTREKNSKLVEKAGREGFQQNKAYREFRAILMHFFVQLAADFFRGGGERAEPYLRRKEELDRLETARREREKRSRKKRRAFEAHLDSSFALINDAEPERETDRLLKSLEKRVYATDEHKTLEQQVADLLDVEAQAGKQLEELRSSYWLEKPSGVGLTRALNRDRRAYLRELERLDEEVFLPAENRIGRIVVDAAQKRKLLVDQRQRIERLLHEFTASSYESIRREAEETEKQLKETQDRVLQLTRQISVDVKEVVSAIESELKRLNLTEMDREELESFRRTSERRISSRTEESRAVLAHIRTQLDGISWSRDEQGYLIGDADMTAALEEELLALRERAEMDLHLSQLGMAIEIINHEFSSSIRTIRDGLRRLEGWADVNPELQSLYQDIRASFDHLDGYLTLFTPLHRRLYRKAIPITGAEIADFLRNLFKERIRRHDIKLDDTKAFRDKTITGYPSTFYPVFVNLVDNSIYWLQDRPLPRKIRLDADGRAFIIADNGPGIPVRDREAVFELGFTRKPGGRGLGLYIAREVLKREGYELELEEHTEGQGAVFRIYPMEP